MHDWDFAAVRPSAEAVLDHTMDKDSSQSFLSEVFKLELDKLNSCTRN